MSSSLMEITEPSIQEVFPEVENFFREYIRQKVLFVNEQIKKHNEIIRQENQQNRLQNERQIQVSRNWGFDEPLVEQLPIKKPLLPKLSAGVVTCCSEDERIFLMEMAKQLKRVYPLISNKDICIAIICTYYALNIGEQTEDYLNGNPYDGYANNNHNVRNLFYAITVGDIPLYGRNLSSEIRQHMFGLNQSRGGNKKGKTKNNKRTGRNCNKRGRKKTYKKNRRMRNKKYKF